MAAEADWGQLKDAFGLQEGDISSLKSAGYNASQASQLLGLSSGSSYGATASGAGTIGTGQLSPTIGGSGLTPQMLTQMAQLFGRPASQQQAPVNQPATRQPVSNQPGDQPTWATDQQASGPQPSNQQRSTTPQPQTVSQQTLSQQSGNQQQMAGRNYQAIGVDPNQPFTNLGAAALGQYAIYNPQPGGGTGAGTDASGNPVSGPVGSGGAGFAGGGGLTIGGVSTQQPQITTSGVIPKAPRGPWTTTPGLFNRAPNLAPTPALTVTPTPQATGMAYQPGQSWATPPPAPGLTFGGGAVPMPIGGGAQQGVPQNWQGAGQVAPSGIPSGGGVPGSAIALGTTPAPYTGTVHNDPFMSNAVSKLMGLASNPWHPEGSSASPAKPIKMAAGGWVPGDPNDNTDSVSARLSPGEYVIPKGQARETVHAPISTSSYSPPPAPSDQQSGQQSTQSPAASTHTDVGAGSATIANLGKLYTGRGAGAVYDAQGNLVTSNPGLTAQAAAGAGSTMMPGGGIRDPSGNVFDSNATLAAQDVGGAGATMPGGGVGGMGQMGSAIGGAIGSIGSALQSALANVPSWKMQPSHIPDPSSFKKQQTQYNLQTPSA